MLVKPVSKAKVSMMAVEMASRLITMSSNSERAATAAHSLVRSAL